MPVITDPSTRDWSRLDQSIIDEALRGFIKPPSADEVSAVDDDVRSAERELAFQNKAKLHKLPTFRPMTIPGTGGKTEVVGHLWTHDEVFNTQTSMDRFPDVFTDAEKKLFDSISMELQYSEMEQLGRVSLLEHQKRTGERLPLGLTKRFVPGLMEARNVLDFLKVQKVKKGTASDQDLFDLIYKQAVQEEFAVRGGLTPGAKFGVGVSSMVPWMLEIMATGGASAFAKRGVSGTAKKLAPVLRKTLLGKIAEKAIRWIAGGAGRAALLPHRTAGEYARRQMPYIDVEAGMLVMPEEGPVTSAFKALGTIMIELMTEEAGKNIMPGKGRLLRKAAGKLERPGLRKVAAKLLRISKKMHGKQTGQMLSRAQYHGILGEAGEERLADIMRGAFKLGRYEEGAGLISRIGQELPELEDLMVETGVLGVPMILGAGLGRVETALVDKDIQKRMAQADILDNFMTSMAEKQPEEADKFDILERKLEDVKGMTTEQMYAELVKPAITMPAEELVAGEEAPVENKRTQNQANKIHATARRRGMSTDERHTFMYSLTHKTSTSDLTEEEASLIIDAMSSPDYQSKATSEQFEAELKLTTREKQRLWKATRNREAYNKLLEYVSDTGGLGLTDDMRKAKLELYRTGARKITKQLNQLETSPSKTRFVNPFLSSEVAFALAEEYTGVPILWPWKKVIEGANESHISAETTIDDWLKKHNHTINKLATDPLDSNDNVAGYLYHTPGTPEHQTILNQISPKDLKRAQEIVEFLAEDSEAASHLRSHRFKQFNRKADKVLEKIEQVENIPEAERSKSQKKSLKKAKATLDAIKPKDMPLSALFEGRQAVRDGTYSEWVKTQRWGTRAWYYLSNADAFNDEKDFIDSLFPSEMRLIEVEGLKAPEYTPSEARTREMEVGPSKKPVYPTVFNHIRRVILADRIFEDVDKFWSLWLKTKPTATDALPAWNKNTEEIKRLLNNVFGRAQREGRIVEFTGKVASAWWVTYGLHLSRFTYFFTRNLLQNIALGGYQLNPTEVARTSYTLLRGKKNPWMVEDFHKDFKVKTTQRIQIAREFWMQQASMIASEHGSRAAEVAMAASGTMLYSDEINRYIWFLCHQSAFSNVQKYRANQKSLGGLERTLALEQLLPAERNYLFTLLDEHQDREFVNRYAELKTLKIHFGYQTSRRSLSEQRKAARIGLGLVNWPRGFLELNYQAGVKPFFEGVRDGNIPKALRGVKHLMYGVLMMYFIRDLTARITGRERFRSYDPLGTIFGYGPGAPGAIWLMDSINLLHNVYQGIEKGREEGKTIEEIAQSVLGQVGYQMEHFIPLMDVLANVCRMDDPDVRYVSEYLIKKWKGDRVKVDWRTTLQKTQSWMFGGHKTREDTRLAEEREDVFDQLMEQLVPEEEDLFTQYLKGQQKESQTFDPEGYGYDYETARKYGLGPDETGHWPSREPHTGQILKGQKHKTYNLTVKGEREAGHRIYKGKNGRYYSQKE